MSPASKLSSRRVTVRRLWRILPASIVIVCPAAMLVPAMAAELQEGVVEELRLLKEETVSIAVRHEQPISEAPSNVYVITDEDIRQSGATDIPTLLRRIPGIDVMQMSGADFNVSAPVGSRVMGWLTIRF